MYLSKLVLNPSPAARTVQRDLASPYELHRSMMRAFSYKGKDAPGRVLFRLEPYRASESPVVLVQSEDEPDWSGIKSDPHYLLSVDTKPYSPELFESQKLWFRLRANPTVKRDGKRHGLVGYASQVEWLERKAEISGFHPVDVTIRKCIKYISVVERGGMRRKETHLGVDYEGVLEVTSPEKLLASIAKGIGPAKGYGFGLLSIAPF